MSSQPVHFYSEGTKLAGDLFLPDDVQPGETRAGIVLCHGYTGGAGVVPAGQRAGAEQGRLRGADFRLQRMG